MRLLRVSAIALTVLLAGCKPPKFDEVIHCPAFTAAHVAVYEYNDPQMLLVVWPDRTWLKVDKTECVVAPEATFTSDVVPTNTGEPF